MTVLTGKDAFEFLKAVDDATEQGIKPELADNTTGYYQLPDDRWVAFDYADGEALVEQFSADEEDRARGWAHREF
jgi:hypothetical protein